MIDCGGNRPMFFYPDGIPAVCGGSAETDKSMRQNLRVPLCFDTYLYPLDNRWTGRRKAISYDLSCGGIAFFCEFSFSLEETFEIVIPVTSKPLLIQASVLRQERLEDGRTLYAAKFIHLCEGEEAMIREAVFSAQLKQHRPG